MIINQLVDEDFVNYKKPSMMIGFPKCTFKCDLENGGQVCQNLALAHALTIDIEDDYIIERFINNPISKSVVIAGLEPFDTFNQLNHFICKLRKKSKATIIIYTGYYKNEIQDKINQIKDYKNIIIKFGRYMPNCEKHFDKILGVYLASDNQYAERVS